VNELELLYYQLLCEDVIAQNERREEMEIQQRAKNAAWRDTNIILAKQKAEQQAAALEPQDRAIFEQLARKTEQFSTCAANFSLVRTHCTPGFTEVQLQDAIESGAVLLAPPSQAEIAQWHGEEVERLAPFVVDAMRQWVTLGPHGSTIPDVRGREQALASIKKQSITTVRQQVAAIEHNRALAGKSTEELKAIAKTETEQKVQAVQAQSFQGTPLPAHLTGDEVRRIGTTSTEQFRQLVKRYGSAPVTARLRES
jgi:hypothetical protein